MANRLMYEESPYLRQHKDNPVAWYPWGKEALEAAKRENKLIFLSIGYSSCHWCHVMEKESFENEKIAKFLNEYFISIKVDKEERPDIDAHFQEIFMKMNKKPGGWPLSIFLTPELIPVYSATYIPDTPRYGMMGFLELLEILHEAYQKDPNKLIQKGQEVLEALKPKSKIEATKITSALIEIATNQIKQVYEPKYGGFGNAPKFPHSYTLNLAMNLFKLTKDEELAKIVTHTLNNMLKGGMYDIVDGGFCRYSTDEKWLVPHFEKMSYDNALMIEVLVKAYRLFKKETYLQEAKKSASFMIEKMSKNNLFFSASDADSNGVEGEYFVFDYNEVKSAFEKEGLSEDLLQKLSITIEGNFYGSSLVRVKDISYLEDEQIKKALIILKELRKKKHYPLIDKKIITANNAMMICALSVLGKEDKFYLELAKNTLKALEEKMSKQGGLYHSALIESEPKIEAFLEDYAWLIKANLSLYEITLDELYLIQATNLANEAIKRFYKNGFWIVGNYEFSNFAKDTDASIPSAVAIMVENLLTIRSLVEPIYEKFAFKTLEVNSYNLMRQPISRPTLTNCAIRWIKDDIIIKAKEKLLQEIKMIEWNYPYTLLKVSLDDNYQVCTNKACFATAKSKDELLKLL